MPGVLLVAIQCFQIGKKGDNRKVMGSLRADQVSSKLIRVNFDDLIGKFVQHPFEFFDFSVGDTRFEFHQDHMIDHTQSFLEADAHFQAGSKISVSVPWKRETMKVAVRISRDTIGVNS